jgi:chorismate mutase
MRPTARVFLSRVNEDAIQRATERLATAAQNRADAADLDAALSRAREQIEALAAAAAELETTLPERVGNAVRDGVREEALPVARQVAEVRGLMNQLIRRLERVEGDLLAERHARVDDLGLIVELITSGWKSVNERLARMEQAATARRDDSAVIYRIEEHRESG